MMIQNAHAHLANATGRLQDWLAPGYTALLVSAVMLPVTGAVVRWVSFRDTFAHPAFLAVNAPIGELATFGIVPVLATAGLIAISIVAATILGESRANLAWMIWGASVVLLLLAALAGYLVGIAYAALATVAFAFALRQASGRLTTGLPMSIGLTIAYVAAGIATGMRTTPSVAGTYAFTGGIAADGRYLQIAQDDLALWLAPCTQPGAVIGIRKDAVASILWQRPARSTGDIDLSRLLEPLHPADLYEGCR